MNARRMAFELLREWEKGKAFADELLSRKLVEASLPSRERALVTELFYGALRQRSLLDWLIETQTDRAPRRAARVLLRLGAYQIFFLSRVPSYAAVSETTALAKAECSAREAQFVHAVLRKLADHKNLLREATTQLRAKDPAIFYSHPNWLVERWHTQWGKAETEALCEWNNTPPPVVLRVNRLKTTMEDLCALLRNSKVSFEPHPNAPNCIVLQDATAEAVPGFREGFFYVQDPSTLLAVELLEPRPGEMVLDACAAPGGKCLYIAEKMQNRGRIVACDVSAKRLELLRENCARLGAGIVEPRQWDFESGEEKGVGTRVRDEDVALTTAAFDRVLVDAPCSNTGVMRRRVDVRWRLRPEDFRRMAARQLKLLRSAAALVTNGGALVYSTCSLESEENEEAVAAFLKSAPRFKLLETRAMFSPRDGMDGAFVAKFVRE